MSDLMSIIISNNVLYNVMILFSDRISKPKHWAIKHIIPNKPRRYVILSLQKYK